MNDEGSGAGSRAAGRLDLREPLALPDAPALLTGPDDRVVQVTEQAAQLLGRPCAALAGMSLGECMVRQGSVVRLNGPHPVLVRCLSWPHEADPRYLVMVLVDVSDMAEAPDPLAAALTGVREGDRLSQVTNTPLPEVQRVAGIGTWEWDPATDLVRLSAVARELLGVTADRAWTREDFIGKMLPEDREHVRRSLRPLAERRDPVPVEYEFRIVRSDGALRTMRVHGRAEHRDDGTAVLAGTLQVVDRTSLRSRPGYDEGTGLPDGRAAVCLLDRLLAGERHDRVAVLSCVPDQLARVGYALGLSAREELRDLVARRLREGLPEEFTVARGQDESTFTVLCPDTVAAGGLEAVTARVSGLLRTTVPVQGHAVQLSAAIGVARAQATTTSGEALLRHAATAAGEAQQRGVDQIVLADLDLIARVARQLPLEQQLREALNGDEFVLHYQPIVDARGDVVRAEALLRWQHPEFGLLGPGYFLEAARRGGLLREIDRWVLRAALRDAARWPPVRQRRLPVAINLAAFVPGDPEFSDFVADAVASSGAEWAQVVLELLETAVVDLRPQRRSAMERLLERGARFAIDDFGTGYSSLARLKDLPAQIIKLDRRFVTDIALDSGDHAVAQAVCALAHAMGRTCTAEGVETAEQLRALSGLGVDDPRGSCSRPPSPARSSGGRCAPAATSPPPAAEVQPSRSVREGETPNRRRYCAANRPRCPKPQR